MDTYDSATGEVFAATAMPPAIAEAIIAVCKQIRQIGQDEKNPHGGYAYVSVDRLYQRVGPMMAEAGLALLVDETSSEVREGASGKAWLFMRYSLSFVHVSGAISPPMRRSLAMPISGPQAFGAAQSYVEKQALRQVFKIPTGEKDADETAPEADAAPRRTPRPPRLRDAVPPELSPLPPPPPLPDAHLAQLQGAANRQNPPLPPIPPPPPLPAAPVDRAEAIKRYNEMMREIRSCTSVAELDLTMDERTCPMLRTAREMVRAADPDTAEAVLKRLVVAADDRRAQLTDELAAFDGR